jgi:ABC-type Fe3+ transport system substrate-binding protein
MQNAPLLHFFGNMAFSLNLAFQIEMERLAQGYLRESGRRLRYCIPVPGDSIEVMENGFADNHESLPELVASIGFENIFQPEFHARFIASGALRAAFNDAVHDSFVQAGLVDPEHQYAAHAVTPYVFLVDKTRLGSLDMPQTWTDLLHPRYRKQIVCNGSREYFSYILLVYIYRMAGMEGIRLLAENVRDAMHASLIARIAGRATSQAAIYIVPWFFAQTCPWRQSTQIVWPRDGAIVSPMWLLRKSALSIEAEHILQFLASRKFAALAASMCSPAAHAAVDHHMPAGATFQWLGWDFLRAHPLIPLKRKLLGEFLSMWQPA